MALANRGSYHQLTRSRFGRPLSFGFDKQLSDIGDDGLE